MSVPFENGAYQKIKSEILVDGAGEAYIDVAQLERSESTNEYNLIENGVFEYGDIGWNMSGEGVSVKDDQWYNTQKSLTVEGDLDSLRYAYQDINVSKKRRTRERYILSGWAKGNGLPKHERGDLPEARFRLRAVIKVVIGRKNNEDLKNFCLKKELLKKDQ